MKIADKHYNLYSLEKTLPNIDFRKTTNNNG